MNRSSRQSVSKQAKLNSPIDANLMDTTPPQSTLSAILPKPSSATSSSGSSNAVSENGPIDDPVTADFFPEFGGMDVNDESSVKSMPISVDGLILPEPLPPLPANLNKVYNTRKRTFNDAAPSPTTSSSYNYLITSNESSSGTNPSKPTVIPGFVSKLYRMVDESTSNLIKWGPDGRTFVVTSPEDFSRQVLPLFFKHNNFSSFVRQLNMYGFHKVPHLQQGSMAASAIGSTETTIWEFSHVNFIRNRPDLLINVRRKIGKDEDGMSPATSNSSITNLNDSRVSSDDFITTARSLRQELSFIYQQQNALRTDLQSLQRDNQLLWNENLASRERHLQQQQVIDRILRFLASVFTTDGKLLASASSGIGAINSNTLSALQANLSNGGGAASNSTGGNQSSSGRQMNRPLLLGNISGNEDELRRHVLELISGGPSPLLNSDKIDLIPDNANHMNFNNQTTNAAFNNRLEDLENTTRDMSKDISLVDEEISNVLNTKLKNSSTDAHNIDSIINENHSSPAPIYDDLDFSSYLDCQ